ncbi:hypothetical protein J8J14_02855 [Roseomonas sp. SSH11]|uniref:Lipoprotein n=1 Tax=Pararoseomonas baculiformis TaxID=2820812 RepID=A0ABS4A9N4_9PROT|nr:hypothetical protein [Pararoseomonas baculiformis]MBP0443707.1 hypothetical protein [Pararoseomonas baculiformis]
MKRILLTLPFLLAACGGGGGGGTVSEVTSRIGLSDPLRDVARTAAFEGTNTAGSPRAGARLAAETEAFAHAAETDPAWTHPRDATLLPKLQIARREMRGALGLPASVPPPVAIRAFATAVDALDRYDTPAAIAALRPVGGAAMLEQLGNLPRLPRVEDAMQAVAIEVNTPQLGN